MSSLTTGGASTPPVDTSPTRIGGGRVRWNSAAPRAAPPARRSSVITKLAKRMSRTPTPKWRRLCCAAASADACASAVSSGVATCPMGIAASAAATRAAISSGVGAAAVSMADEARAASIHVRGLGRHRGTGGHRRLGRHRRHRPARGLGRQRGSVTAAPVGTAASAGSTGSVGSSSSLIPARSCSAGAGRRPGPPR